MNQEYNRAISKPQIWTAEYIREQMRTSKKSFVIRRGGEVFDLLPRRASTLEGDFQVQERAYEVIVTDNYRRIKAPSGL